MLDKQLHIGYDFITQEKFVPVKNAGQWNKPRAKTGLWTSTYDVEYGADWVQWCIDNEFNLPEDNNWPCSILVPNDNARIYTVDSKKNLAELLLKYGIKYNTDIDFMSRTINFVKMAQDYDGIHLTKDGQWDTRYNIEYNLYGWDCECTLWLNWAFKFSEFVGYRKFKSR